jgi:hypothetical protein
MLSVVASSQVNGMQVLSVSVEQTLECAMSKVQNVKKFVMCQAKFLEFF